ncbi:MAG: hypothetical protein P4L51_30365 [Puia sp.]|nr:hypothetical protein [Puia sp.]
MRSETPVLLVIFNRPDTTKAVMEALQTARPRHLLIAADAPRIGRQGEAELCAETRDTVLSMINWPCEPQWRTSETNLGCGPGVASAISWALTKFETTIVLEDDCVPHPDFFAFVDAMLDRYRDDPRVMLVSGINVLRGRYKLPYSYGFSRYPLTWGWATWRHSWERFDYNMKAWPAIRESGVLVDILGDKRVTEYWMRELDKIVDGSINTWDYQLHLAMWLHGAYSVYPSSNFITNIGLQGTHTNTLSPVHNLPTAALQYPLKHPPVVYRDLTADALIRRAWYLPTVGDRVSNKLRKIQASRFFRRGQ